MRYLDPRGVDGLSISRSAVANIRWTILVELVLVVQDVQSTCPLCFGVMLLKASRMGMGEWRMMTKIGALHKLAMQAHACGLGK